MATWVQPPPLPPPTAELADYWRVMCLAARRERDEEQRRSKALRAALRAVAEGPTNWLECDWGCVEIAEAALAADED